MNLFHRKPCPAHAKAVEAVFAQNLTAQVRAGEAAAGVTRSSDQTRHHLQRLRREIAERTDEDRFARPQPHTSDVRSLVDTVLARVQPRPDQKG